MTPEEIANAFIDNWTYLDDPEDLTLTADAKRDLATQIRNAVADHNKTIITRLQQQKDSIADINTPQAKGYKSGLADAIAIIQLAIPLNIRSQEQPQ